MRKARRRGRRRKESRDAARKRKRGRRRRSRQQRKQPQQRQQKQKTTKREENQGNGQKQRQDREEIAQDHSDCSEPLRLLRNRSLLPKQIFLPKKFLQTFSKDDPLFSKIRGGVAPIRRVAVNRFPEERRKTAEGTVATGAARDLCGGLPVVQPRPTIPSGGGETTRRGW